MSIAGSAACGVAWGFATPRAADRVANSTMQLHHDRMMGASSEEFEFLDWRNVPPEWARGGVVVVGNFDGVHLGHVALIQHARQLAASLGTRLTIITFDPHPLLLLAPERFQPTLTTIRERVCNLLCHPEQSLKGADGVIVLRTDHELLQLSSEEFFQNILVDHFQAKGIVEGFNFRFGKDRAGSVEMLRNRCEKVGIRFQIVEPFKIDKFVVSSSQVRDAVEAGHVELAAKLLGRPFGVTGRVVEGARRGRTIGFPTANLGDVRTLVPANGVYAVRVSLDRLYYHGAANIGPNPTFGEDARKIEVHLLDFSGDLYGRELFVEFHQRLRETRKFRSVDELTLQMKQDIEAARQILES